MRAGDAIQRLFARRDPEKDTYIKIAYKLGYKSVGSITDLLSKDDMYVSTLYKICKYFGYVIVIMKPDDDTGNSDMVINMRKAPMPLTDQDGKLSAGRPRVKKPYYKKKYDRYRGVGVPTDKPVVLRSRIIKKKVIPGEVENECKNDT